MNRVEPFSTVVICVETQLSPKDGRGWVQHQLLIWLRLGAPDVYICTSKQFGSRVQKSKLKHVVGCIWPYTLRYVPEFG